VRISPARRIHANQRQKLLARGYDHIVTWRKMVRGLGRSPTWHSDRWHLVKSAAAAAKRADDG